MPLTRIALYRASVLADNLGVRLCAAALMVMPSALVFLLPMLGLFGAADDALLPGAPLRDLGGPGAVLALALAVGFAAVWLRIAVTGSLLLRRPGLRRFVTVGLGVGIAALATGLALLPGASAGQDPGWLILASLTVSVFLLAATLGQPRTDRLNRL